LRPPHPNDPRGRGLWIARQLCELLHVWSDGRGTHVRLQTAHACSSPVHGWARRRRGRLGDAPPTHPGYVVFSPMGHNLSRIGPRQFTSPGRHWLGRPAPESVA
jgi:hypothetical protein